MAIFQYVGLSLGQNSLEYNVFASGQTPDRTFEHGETIQWRHAGAFFNDFTFFGVERNTGYVILQRTVDTGDGDTEIEYAIIFGDTDPNPGSTTYRRSNLIDRDVAAVRIGNPPTFADYGLRRDMGDTDEYTSRDREVELDHGTYDVGSDVDLRIVTKNADGVVDNIEFRVTAKFQGFDRDTGDAIFDAPENPPPDFPAGRDMVLSDRAGGLNVIYDIARDHIIDTAPLRTGDVTFSQYAVRSDTDPTTLETDGQFMIPQDATAGMVRFGHGLYPDDDALTITVDGTDTQVTLVGYESDTNYPIFLDAAGNGGAGRLIVAFNSGNQGTVYNVDNIVEDMHYITCFAPGTLIATPDGERPVETLGPGDKVLTADCGVETVKWVGVQKVPTMFGAPELTRPVRIMAGALYENTPHTDLIVTRDHGMILDGVICNAGALVNGTSIVEVSPGELTDEMAREPGTGPHGLATYYHVETENHVPLLANGAAAESFIDNVDRARFGNHSEFVALYGETVPAMTEMNLPRAMSARQLPRRIALLLDERAAMLLESIAEETAAKSA